MGIGPNVSVTEEEGALIIAIDGRLDAITTPLVEKKLKTLLESSEHLAIDFSNVDYLSSAGMRLLLSITKKMDAKKGKIALFGMDEGVLEIIKMAGFERILKIYSSKRDALKSLQ